MNAIFITNKNIHHLLAKSGAFLIANLPTYITILLLTAAPTCMKYNPNGLFHFAMVRFGFGLIGAIWLTTVLTVLASFSKPLKALIISISALLAYVEFFIFVEFKTRLSDRIIALVFQTNSREVSEFFSQYILTPTSLQIALTIIAATIIILYLGKLTRRHIKKVLSVKVAGALLCTMNCVSIALLSITLTTSTFFLTEHAAYPSYEQLYAAYLNYRHHRHNILGLESTTIKADGTLRSDSDTPELIIWIIGESFNKHHSPFYGYPLNTQPLILEESNNIVIFKDATTPAASTSSVLQCVYTTSKRDEDFENSPLAITIMRNAGYTISLHDNQTTAIAGDSRWDTENMWFLNSRIISDASLDYRNQTLLPYDLDFVKQELSNLPAGNPALAIFHLQGQHMPAKARYPESFSRFSVDDYSFRPELDNDSKRIVASYDNATAYNDSVIHTIIKAIENKDAIIIYHSDHGEEVYDYRNQYGRTWGVVTKEMFRNIYEIPLMIYTTAAYRQLHPETYQRIINAASKPVNISDISHTLLDIAGVSSIYYKPDRSFLSTSYKAPPTILDEVHH